MGETSSRTGGRGRRGAGRAGGSGEHCTMCGATVAVDAQGRCPLGHRVRAPEDADGVIAAYAEPPTGAADAPAPTAPQPRQPDPAPDVDESDAGTDRRPEPEQAPPPQAAAWHQAWVSPGDEPATLRIPDRLRRPLPPAGADQPDTDQPSPLPAEPVPAEPVPAEPVVVRPREPAGRPAADGPVSALGDAPTGEGHVPVPMTDLSPGAPSILDDVPPSEWGPTVSETAGFAQEPLEDDADVVEPAGWGTRLAGALFVLFLLAAAWYLATSL